MAKTKETVSHAADSARPYVERALHDEELHESVKRAFDAARQAYEDLSGASGVTGAAQRLAFDRDVQENLRLAMEELRHAADRLRAKEEHRARGGLLLLTGIAIGVLFNPWTGPETRRWLRERLLGDGSEFDYAPGSGNGGLAAA